MKYRIISVVAFILVTSLVVGCSAQRGPSARVTPTPTKTLRPVFTSTPTPAPKQVPTDTAVPTATTPPTDTAVPPTETATPAVPASATEAPPTDTPSSTEPPPTDTPPPTEAMPSNTPLPRPSDTPLPTNTPRPQVDYRVVQQVLVPKQENPSGLYTIFVRVEDAAGNPVEGLVVWDPGQPAVQVVTGEKPGYYHAEYLMGGGDYYLEVKDARSEKTKRLTTVRTGISNADLIGAGYCVDDADCDANVGPQHFSWRVVFRRTW